MKSPRVFIVKTCEVVCDHCGTVLAGLDHATAQKIAGTHRKEHERAER